VSGPAPVGGAAFRPIVGPEVGPGGASGAPGFGDLLTQALDRADGRVVTSDRSVADYLSGKAQSTHEVMIHLEEAQLALQYTVQLRNRALEAYNEVMRMPM
jgi:flagellar hook-basal body complex protein FliE